MLEDLLARPELDPEARDSEGLTPLELLKTRQFYQGFRGRMMAKLLGECQ